MTKIADVIEEIRELNDSDWQQVLRALEKPAVSEMETAPYKLMRMSEVTEEVEAQTPVFIMDKKLRRKIRIGEEGKQDEIASAEGTLEGEMALAPGGTTTISGPTISSTTLSQAMARDFGPVAKGGAIFISDTSFFLYHDNDIKKVLAEDLTDLQMWINTYFDCDDFSQVVAGVLNNRLKGVPFGVLWFRGPGIYHAVNCFYSATQKKMKVVEPQNDAIYDFDKTKYNPVLVVI